MYTKRIVILLLLIFTNVLYSQKENLSRYKKKVPSIIKSLQKLQLDRGNINESYDNRVTEVFKKPWEMKRIDDELSQEMIASILKNQKFYIEEDEAYKGTWNAVFSSSSGSETGEKIKDVFFSYDPVPNVFVTLSNIKLFDEHDVSITKEKELRTTVDKLTGIVFFNGSIPLTHKIEKLTGSFDVTLKEFKNIDYKIFKQGDVNIEFSLGGIDGFKLIKVEKNKAFVELPKYLKNLKVASTNKNDKEFTHQGKGIDPKKVVVYALGGKINEKSTKLLVENLKEEDLILSPQILIHETNGIIEHFYIYTKSDPVILNSKTIKVKI